MKNVLKRAFFLPEDEKLTDENIGRKLLPSFIGIIVCAIILFGLTYAWYCL